MDWEAEYKKETSRDAQYKVEAPENCNCFNWETHPDYIEWLEEKLTKHASEPADTPGAESVRKYTEAHCPECGSYFEVDCGY